MNKKIVAAFAGTLAFALCFAGCGKKGEAPKTQLPSGTVSAEKNSFNAVAAQLDAGGNFYLYLSTEKLLENLSGSVEGWRGLFMGIPDMDAEGRMAVGKAFDVVTSLIKNSGIEDVSGFGMSSIAVEEKVYHSKAFLHHYSGRGQGFLWNLFGAKQHPLTGLDMLPASTALALFTDVDVPLMWTVIKKEVHNLKIPEADSALERLPAQFEMATGLNWDKVLKSLGGEFGIALTLDENKKLSIPMSRSEKFEMPEPGLVIVMRVQDDTIFKRIDQALEMAGPQVVRVDESGLKMRTMPVPVPLPISVRPTIALAGDYMFISYSDSLIQEMLAVKSGKQKGLKSTDEFKRLSKNVPEQGNQFTFLSERFGKTIVEVQKMAVRMMPTREAAQQRWMQSLFGKDDAAFTYSVSANTDEGWLTVGNGNQNPAIMLAVIPAAAIGMMAAIAVPNFVRARETSQSHACINNLRQLDGAKAQWALENNKKSTDRPSMSELQPYLHGRLLVCPQGGNYTVGPVGDSPTCSHRGHSL